VARRRLTNHPLPLRSLVNPKSGEESRKLLDNLHGSAQPGRLLALMGSSGAGKTTLLNALSGQVCVRRPPATHSASYNANADPLR